MRIRSRSASLVVALVATVCVVGGTSAPAGGAAQSAGSWRKLGVIPARAIWPDAAVWTGRRLVIWDARRAAPIEFELGSGAYRRLPRAPLASRAGAVMAWTGHEVLVWGGTPSVDASQTVRGASPYTDGAAYSPETHRWRRLPLAPVVPRLALGAVWTGHELLVSGGPPRSFGRVRELGDVLTDGAAYSPADNRWRRIPPSPVPVTEGVVRWTGREMLVFGSLRDDFPETGHSFISDARGALYDPSTHRWRELTGRRGSGIGGVGPTAAVAGDTVVAIDPALHPRVHALRGSSEWRDAPGLQARDRECFVDLTSGGGTFWLSQCGHSWRSDGANPPRRWIPVAAPSVRFSELPWGEPIWTGTSFILWEKNPALERRAGEIPAFDEQQKDLIVWSYTPAARIP